MTKGLRDGLRSIRAAMRQRLGFRQAEARDLDYEQAFLRTVLGSAVLAYALYLGYTQPAGFTPGLRLAVIATSLVVTAGAWMMYWFKRHAHRPSSMRYFGIIADIIPMTIGLWGADELGVPVIGIYLWVTVGNGFRYGPRYLLAAYGLSLVCFVALTLFVPFWREHREIGVGYLLVLATIPLYVLVLLSRLTAQKDAAVELLNAKTRFVANVSHELRTPLTGVFAVYDLLRRRRLTPDERELVGSLGSAITSLKSSVDAVLQASKLEAGAEKTNPRLFNLRHFLWQMSVLVRPQAEAKKLAWRLELDRTVPGTVYGDFEHLQHVLGNLVNNALKFTAQGSVSLRVARVPAGVRFEVTDTGIGIPLAAQETLFERFVQVDDSATRRYGGTGLGTSIAADLVRLMGGSIGVRSAPGSGSTFWVELPLADHPEAALPSWGARTDVLLIGPASAEVEALSAMLTGMGIAVERRPATPSPSPRFDSTRYLTALLVLPPAEAARYAHDTLQDLSGAACPWIVVSSTWTPPQQSALLNVGAAAILPASLPPADWRRHLAALANRLDLAGANADEPQPLSVTRALEVLLADDNQSNRLLLARILQDAGHTVHVVSRGDEAFDRMSVGDLDLAILDLNMPEMSGPDVIKLYRASEVGASRKLPIIVFSADATPAAREESLAAGANDYLTKPVTAVALLAMIERLIAGVPARQAAPSTGRSVARAPSQDAAPEPGSKGPPPALVDGERMEALRRISRDDSTFHDQYINAAFDDIEAAVIELRDAVAKGNARAARDALHKIDGTGASIGATALLASAKNMRQYVTTKLDPDAASAMAELVSTCALTKSAVRAHLTRAPQGGPR